MYVEGVLVVGKSDVIGKDGKIYKPVNSTSLKEGDRIIKINNKIINNSIDLIDEVNKNGSKEMLFEYVRDGQKFIEKITPIYNREDGTYRLGMWVKDGAIGIGTLSFYNPITKQFGALGHGVTDIDTGKLLEVKEGKLLNANIIGIAKGKRSIPGEIKGVFNEGKIIGEITKNINNGIYGTSNEIVTLDKYKNGIKLAIKDEVEVGDATILSTIDNEIKEYTIKIEKIYKHSNSLNKDMLIKITDKELIEITGGIIQGMSGSPIIQNGKLVGAVTHVLVNDPTKGYGTFAQTMYEQMNSL